MRATRLGRRTHLSYGILGSRVSLVKARPAAIMIGSQRQDRLSTVIRKPRHHPAIADNGRRPSVAEWRITGILDLNAGVIGAYVTDHRRNNASYKLSWFGKSDCSSLSVRSLQFRF